MQRLKRFLIRSLRFLVQIVFSILIGLGKWLGLSEEELIGRHIRINNYLVKHEPWPAGSNGLFLLAPSCLQNKDCTAKITNDIQECRRCGRCNVKDLLEMAETRQLPLMVVTGGTVARERVKENNYGGVIAIACERELETGIRDAFPLPVIAIINERPEGPCVNTRIDMKKVEEGVNELLEGA
ncbi:MAG: DUF116 domain-containing protein [bacterium]|nr:DUF116 domain-containing protein [bacterium]